MKRRKEVRIQTIIHRRDYNQAQKELLTLPNYTKVFSSKVSHFAD